MLSHQVTGPHVIKQEVSHLTKHVIRHMTSHKTQYTLGKQEVR